MAEKKYVSDNVQLMNEWDWKRNLDLDPTQISLGSHKKLWWKCIEGHEWLAEVKSRNKGIGCPFCHGRIAVKGKNDLKRSIQLWQRNGIIKTTPDYLQKRSSQIVERKFGGYVVKGTNGKQWYIVETAEVDAQFVIQN